MTGVTKFCCFCFVIANYDNRNYMSVTVSREQLLLLYTIEKENGKVRSIFSDTAPFDFDISTELYVIDNERSIVALR